ncbi:MAG: PDZ domain-containing protein, partial [Bacteroidales bacterium]|nr:PDZ domain-containing protein [Bacteroidales bacterium]
MKSKTLKYFSIFVIFIAITLFAQKNNNDEKRSELLIKVVLFAINNGHYQPEEINDDFSNKAFNLYLDRLDYSKRFLLQEDIDNLKKYEFSIDNQILEANFDFLDLSIEIINKRNNEAEKYYKEILDKPFDFEKDENIELDEEKIVFATDKKQLKEIWRKYLKYETLTRLSNMIETQEKAIEKNDTTIEIKSFELLEKEARKKVLKRYNDWFHRLSKINYDDRLMLYINSIVNIFDPHTQYFPPKDKENFDIRFSGQLEGIGAQLTQKNEYIEVLRIIPGSPSWKQGELEVGDMILKVAQGDEEPVDVVDMRLDKAVLLIRGKKGTEVKLTVKKLDGSIVIIPIIRDIVILEETYAKSTIIKDKENNTNIGYLKL